MSSGDIPTSPVNSRVSPGRPAGGDEPATSAPARSAPAANGTQQPGMPIASHRFDTGEGGSTTVEISLLPPISGNLDLTGTIARLSVKVKTSNMESQTAVIEIEADKAEAFNKKALEDTLKNLENMGKAKKSGKLSQVFGWIATIASVVVAAVTANPALMVVALAGVAMMVASETGGMEKLAEKVGPEAMIAIMVVIGVVMLVAPTMLSSAGSAIATATTAGTRAATSGMQAASTGTRAAAGGTQAVSAARTTTTVGQQAIQVLKVGAEVTGYAAGVASSSGQIRSALYQRDAGEATASSKQNQALATQRQDTVDEAQELLTDGFELADRLMKFVAKLVDDSAATNRIIQNNFA